MSSSWEIHLLLTLQFLILTGAYKHTSDVHLNLSVSLEQKVEFLCNVSSNNLTQITWRKDSDLIFSFQKKLDKIVKNFSSERMSIDAGDPGKLRITAVQMTDVGIYLCDMNTPEGVNKMKWTLNIKGADSVSQRNTKEIIMYSVAPAVAGMCVIVGICCALLLYKKQNQNSLDTDDMGAMMYSSGERCEFVTPMTTTEYQLVGKIKREKSCWSDYFQRVNYLEVKTQDF